MDAAPRSSPAADRRVRVAFLPTAAYVVILVAGLKAAADLLVPLLLAAMLAVVCIPPTRRLQRWGVPDALSIVAVVLGIVVFLLGLSGVLGRSVSGFTASLGQYEAKANEVADQAASWLERMNLYRPPPDGARSLSDMVDPGSVMNLVANTMNGVVATLSNMFLILLVVTFVLLEANGFSAKLRRAFGDEADLARFARMTDQVYGYLTIKTLISLLTGVLVSVMVAAAGVDFPVLWGLVAFVFNYVPNVGSVLAAVPAVLLALIQHGLGTAALVAAGFVAINTVIGNLVEPRVMGRRLGLSPLVVILSLIFWAWVWGPVGMLLSLPLTMVVKILLENSPDFRFVSVLLGPAHPAD